MEIFVLPNQLLKLTGLNTAWLVVHSPYFRHLREIADGSRIASAMKQNFCRLLRSACVYITVSPCIHTAGTHAPTSYSNITANTTAISCAVGLHTPAVLPGCLLYVSSFKLTLELAA